jgi:acetyl esterase/lipase
VRSLPTKCVIKSILFLAINYRKALGPETAYPAQLLDALSGYAYLRSLGFESENIILIGDSSGAHIHLGLARYLAEIRKSEKDAELGMPGAVMLVSVRHFIFRFIYLVD